MMSQYPQRIAEAVLVRFIDYRDRFQTITARAQRLFEQADWHGIQQAVGERIDLYEINSQQAADAIIAEIGEQVYDAGLWHDAKQAYIRLIWRRTDGELAETFYNSLYCKVFKHRQIDNEHMFIRSTMEGKEIHSGDQIYRVYTLERGLVAMLSQLLDDYAFAIPWENKRRDLRNLASYVRKNLPEELDARQVGTVEVVRSRFFRNKGAYIVGRVHFGERQWPFVLPVLHNEQGAVYVDTAITDENEVSIVFSFTRSYFMVDVNVPSEFIRFLHSLIPGKSLAELYSSIGFYKQGKAEFYRAFMDHLELSADQFVVAPGIKGMVMTVFTLPSYPIVFKVIKDRFSSSKHVTRKTVKEKYQLVKRHDRVGRMADTQEFTNFVFPRERFNQALLGELQEVAGSSIVVDQHSVTIRHLWTERRMEPLNIYVDKALAGHDEYALFHAINEFGKAIKQLAAANIFAGDMLFKNFGVTRHGRVVFYDYDEIMYITECNFRRIPEPIYPEQELSGEPWYSVGPNDVFPEEFSILTACNPTVRKIFNELHGDLLDVGFWHQMQEQVRRGDIVDVFPYRKVRRFSR
ncbi:bifunctional isocitrate dehydrogenase kinase/phosphatase [Marinobacterium arenosum]|uniref:bifunctional isocitrate dehydrogenase kinase/phosphatase n=1 Tax=Marinobacterium arenosum TaxID=2862496 RepID=UPI001C9450AA|nr:bifunctional isocitrate dehydrogenase kinase/phosphatase [Marinobacterium arenosum]MBY4678259.1 bifunctional isocitrate dehydrogenase kinase/phosphatase [Marinobacterium arenosum]